MAKSIFLLFFMAFISHATETKTPSTTDDTVVDLPQDDITPGDSARACRFNYRALYGGLLGTAVTGLVVFCLVDGPMNYIEAIDNPNFSNYNNIPGCNVVHNGAIVRDLTCAKVMDSYDAGLYEIIVGSVVGGVITTYAAIRALLYIPGCYKKCGKK
jgi:hypothetical protein